jgi:hypothetical protein
MDYELLLLFALAASNREKNLFCQHKNREWIIKCIELPSNWFTLILSLWHATRTKESEKGEKKLIVALSRCEILHEKTIPRSFIGKNLNYYL